jgi:quinol monooxygenase YgiN
MHAPAARARSRPRSTLSPCRRAEPGCIGYQAVRGSRDPALFFIHSRWKDEAAFEHHAALPHTVRFLATVGPLIDHPLDVARAARII